VIEVLVKQPLLRSVLPDGTVVLLVVLHDDRCAILRNNVPIYQAGGDADGIDGAVQRFMAMTQVSDVLGGEDESETKASSASAPQPPPSSPMTRMEHPSSPSSSSSSTCNGSPAGVAPPRPAV